MEHRNTIGLGHSAARFPINLKWVEMRKKTHIEDS